MYCLLRKANVVNQFKRPGQIYIWNLEGFRWRHYGSAELRAIWTECRSKESCPDCHRSTRSASIRRADLAFADDAFWTDRLRLPQIATTATSRPEALTSRFMSPGSPVRIVAFCRRAVVTTTASTTSEVLVMPNSRPASCASDSPRGTTTHPVKKRRSWACCGDRLTCATTGAGTNGTTPSSKRALCSAHARRSFLSAATRTAAS